MPGCNCPGQSCGCAFQAGPGLSLSGTGSANNPYSIRLESRAIVIDQASAGPLDLSPYVGDVAITVNLRASVTEIILPSAPGTRIDLFLVLAVAGRTVAFPSSIRWASGSSPALPTVVGKALWAQLRQTADFWAGIHLSSTL